MPRRNSKTTKGRGSAPVSPAARVAGHRVRQSLAGRSRIEVLVPTRDVALVRQVAERLRATSPAEAARVRAVVAGAVAPPEVRTGKELVQLLRSAPLDGMTLEFERDRTPARDLDL